MIPFNEQQRLLVYCLMTMCKEELSSVVGQPDTLGGYKIELINELLRLVSGPHSRLYIDRLRMITGDAIFVRKEHEDPLVELAYKILEKDPMAMDAATDILSKLG